jgi:isopenicillin-N epimerase
MLPAPSEFARHWAIDPGVCFLNHGSFGGTPRVVMAAQDALRARMEAETIRFFVKDFTDLVDRARRSLAAFLRCDWDELAPVPNATVAVATVLDSLVDEGLIAPGDELLTNDHEYPACQNNLRRAARRSGAKVVTAELPFPCPSPDAMIDGIMAKVSARTRLVLLSHVTSPTGLVMPVERIVRELESRGIMTLVDGAHAPGMVKGLDLRALGASFYTANCHKWICSPKGSAFLHVRKDHQDRIRPLALSNNAEKPKPGRSQFLTEFEYVGTSDYTAFMCIPEAIEFMSGLLPGGFDEVMDRNRRLCLEGRDIICRELGITPPAPDSMIGAICTMILPPHDEARRLRLAKRPSVYHDAIQDEMLRRHSIQVPFWGLPSKPDRFVRISAQLHNSTAQYEALAHAIKALLEDERRA